MTISLSEYVKAKRKPVELYEYLQSEGWREGEMEGVGWGRERDLTSKIIINKGSRTRNWRDRQFYKK